jgi:hypothetical protein
LELNKGRWTNRWISSFYKLRQMADRVKIAAVLAHGFAGAVRSTRLATVLLELHPTQLGRRGVAWGT